MPLVRWLTRLTLVTFIFTHLKTSVIFMTQSEKPALRVNETRNEILTDSNRKLSGKLKATATQLEQKLPKKLENA